MTSTLTSTSLDNTIKFDGVLSSGFGLSSIADIALKASGQFWLLVAVIGQLVFVYYILFFYGVSIAQGNMQKWNEILPHGYIAGDTMGNIAVAAHVLLAAIITLGGPLQLMPQIREKMPSFHRFNGRLYIVTAFITSLTGLYMVWSRQVDGDVTRHLGNTLNAILVMVFAVVAVRFAMVGKIATHRRWALRLFLAVSGVWFFRVGLMLWIFLNDGPVGFDPQTFKGPAITFLNFAQYLLPLGVLELYLLAQDRANAIGRMVMALLLLVLTGAMGTGIVMATLGLWLPRI